MEGLCVVREGLWLSHKGRKACLFRNGSQGTDDGHGNEVSVCAGQHSCSEQPYCQNRQASDSKRPRHWLDLHHQSTALY